MTDYQGSDRRRYYTVQEVADLWNVSVDVIYAAVKKGALQAYRVGTCLRVRVADAEAFGSPVSPSSTGEGRRR